MFQGRVRAGAVRHETRLAGVKLETVESDFFLQFLESTHEPFARLVIGEIDAADGLRAPPSELSRLKVAPTTAAFPVTGWLVVAIDEHFHSSPEDLTDASREHLDDFVRRLRAFK